MNKQVLEHYQSKAVSQDSIFDEVIPLHEEASHNDFSYFLRKASHLPKGYYELAKLPREDRLEFTSSFWETTLSYSPKTHDFLKLFFSKVDDIGVYLVKKPLDQTFLIEFVYSLNNEEGFYKGSPSGTKEQINHLAQSLQTLLPEDYQHFLQIHNGFSKSGDLGLIHTETLMAESSSLQNEVLQMKVKPLFQSKPVDPSSLIPFYKSSGMFTYQCFYKGWYPEKEMGNVLISIGEGSKVDFSDASSRLKKMVFPTFLDWLFNYMEPIDV